MSAQKHTQEPWREVDFYMSGRRVGVDDGEGGPVCYFHDASKKAKANARRIVACVNACAGLDSELLKNIVDLGDSLRSRFESFNRVERELTKQRDDLLAALEEISGDYADRFDLESKSTNPGIKYVIEQARTAIASVKESKV